jgi:tetratricopeptide (TPR) repeat protein
MIESRPVNLFIDRGWGNPIWVADIDQKVKEARFRSPDLLLTQALGHQLLGDIEFARQIYEEISKDARALNNLGVMLLEKDPNDARGYFERAMKLDPDFVPAIYNLGLMTDDHKLIDQAQAADPWRVKAYQKYAPDKPWILIPTISEWGKALYWSQGGFFVRGFTEFHFLSRAY